MTDKFPMSPEDIEEFKNNAVKVLRNNTQYATAKAVEIAFNALGAIGQIMWERDVAIEQLHDIGLGFGCKTDGVYLSKKEYEELLEYKFMYEDLMR